jgi:hypothetical protein
MDSSLSSRTTKKAETMNRKERMRMLEQIRRSPDGVRRIIYIYVQCLLRLRRADEVNALVDGMVTEILDWEFPESRTRKSRNNVSGGSIGTDKQQPAEAAVSP